MEYADERPVKRARLACEPCRRKKAKCSGEQPVCALCHRLQQVCLYREETAHSVRRRPGDEAVDPSSSSARDDYQRDRDAREDPGLLNRVAVIETTLRELVHILHKAPSQGGSTSATDPTGLDQTLETQASASDALPQPSTPASLPPRTVLLRAAEVYLRHVECQPFPLFEESSFVLSLPDRDPAVIRCVLAAASRVSGDDLLSNQGAADIHQNVETAYRLVMRRITDGGVSMSTLQALCLLVLLYFDAGHVERGRMVFSLLSSLAQSAQLQYENHLHADRSMREERRRCYWATVLLCRLLDEPQKLTNSKAPWIVPMPRSTCPVPPVVQRAGFELGESQVGAIKFVFQMSEMLCLTMSYVKGCRTTTDGLSFPWSPDSQYTKVTCAIMDQAHEVPLSQRYRSIKVSSLSREMLEQSRPFWYAWMLGRMLYHVSLCVLNHPVLLTLQVGNIQKVSDAFLSKTSHAITNHTSWIMHYIEFMNSRRFYLVDIYAAYCAGVVATIELQRSLSRDETVYAKSKSNFDSCLSFISIVGKSWSYAERLADRLRNLAADMSARADRRAGDVDDGIIIDVGDIFDILYLPSALRNSSGAGGTQGSLMGPDLQMGMSGSRRDKSSLTRLPRISPITHEPLQNPSPVSTIPPDETGHVAYRASDPNMMMGDAGPAPMVKDLVLPFNDFFFNPFQQLHQWPEELQMSGGDLLMYEAEGLDDTEELQTMY